MAVLVRYLQALLFGLLAKVRMPTAAWVPTSLGEREAIEKSKELKAEVSKASEKAC